MSGGWAVDFERTMEYDLDDDLSVALDELLMKQEF